MSTKFVWLGKKSSLNANGEPTINFTANSESLFPALQVEVSDTTAAIERIRPAVVFARENSGVVSFLELAGATLSPVSDPDPWRVAAFDLDCGSDAISAPSGTGVFQLMSQAAQIEKEAPNAAIGHLKADLRFRLDVPADGADDTDSGGTQFSYVVTLNSYHRRGAGGEIDIAGFTPVVIRFIWSEGEVETRVEENLLLLTSTSITYQKLQGSDVDVRRNSRGEIVIESSNNPTAAEEEPESFVSKINLGDLRVQLSTGGVAFVRGAAPSPAIFRADFNLPLIHPDRESAFSADRPESIPARNPGNESEALGLKFGIEFQSRSLGTSGVEPEPLFEYRRQRTGLPALAAQLHLFNDPLTSLFGKLDSFDPGQALSLPSLGGSLQQLAGLGGSGDNKFSFLLKSAAEALAGGEKLLELAQNLIAESGDIPIPLALEVDLKRAGKLCLLLVLRFNVWRARLTAKRGYFYVVLKKPAPTDTADDSGVQWIDLQTAAVAIPGYSSIPTQVNAEGQIVYRLPTPEDHDGYIDFDSPALAFDFQRSSGSVPAAEAAFPGEFDLSATKTAPTADELKSRLRLQLERFDPDDWQSSSLAKAIMLRIGGRGISFNMKAIPASTTQVAGDDSEVFAMRLADRGDGAGQLVAVDSRVVYGRFSANLDVPALDLRAGVDISVNQAENRAPVIQAVIAMHREGPLVDFQKLPMFRIGIDPDGLEVTLSWKAAGRKQWGIEARVSGFVSLKEGASAPGGLNSLTKPKTLRFEKVNLLNLNKGAGNLILGDPPGAPSQGQEKASGAIDFSILDGRFAVRAAQVRLSWNTAGEKLIKLQVLKASLTFAEPGQARITVEPGDLGVLVKTDTRSVELELPSSLGVDVQIGSTVRVRAQLGWLRDGIERAFFGRGTVAISGLPEVTASLKIGTGLKNDGSRAFQLMVFGEVARDFDLFGGAVMKNIGLGLAVNNRPAGFGADPNADEILKQLPTLDVADPLAWKFVRERGTFVMIAMRTLIGANRGDAKTLSAYLLELLVTVDTNLDAVAAGKLWLFSSPDFVSQPENRNRPAAVAAAVLRLRQKTFTLVAESCKKPAFQEGGQLAKLFDRGSVRLSTFLSTELADFYLERVSYADKLFGFNVEVSGQFRIAVGRFGMLTRASLSFTGSFAKDLPAPPLGGFSIAGRLQLHGEFAGLIVGSGFASYATIDVSFKLEVNGYLYLPGVAWQTKHVRQVIPAVIITVYRLKRKRWRVKWEKREVTISERRVIEFDVRVLVPTIVKKFADPADLEVNFSGGAAFDESGRLGFSGSASVTLNVLGVSKRLKGSLSFQPGIVQDVRNRVAAIESDLDRLRGLPAPARPAAEDAAPAQVQQWYYLKRRHGSIAYHVWLPAPGADWLVPRHDTLDQYANQPRRWPLHGETNSDVVDPDDPARQENPAGDVERGNASPFRDQVTRLVIETQRIRRWTLELHNSTQETIQPGVLTIESSDSLSNWSIEKPAIAIPAGQTATFGVTLDTKGEIRQFQTTISANVSGQALKVVPEKLKWAAPPQTVELAMPWDRYNYDAIQADDPQYIKAAGEHLARLETLFLETAASPTGLLTPVRTINDLLSQLSPATRLVSDPRWESAGALFLTPEAATLPPYVVSADFRPTAELVALEGRVRLPELADVLERLKLYLSLRAQAVREELHSAADPDKLERVRQARAQIMQRMVSETDSPEAPELFGEIPNCPIVMTPDPGALSDESVISTPRRRRLPILVKAGAEFGLTLDMLQNATDLPELLPFVAVRGETIVFKVSVDSQPAPVGNVSLIVPSADQGLEEALVAANLPFTELRISAPPIQAGLSVEFAVHLTLLDAVVQANPQLGSLRVVQLPCRAMETPFDARSLIRQTGVVLTTRADYTFDPAATKLRIFRRDNGAADEEIPSVATIAIRNLVEVARPVGEVIESLKLRQRFFSAEFLRLAGTDSRESTLPEIDGAVRLYLPVRLQEGFFRDLLPMLSHFVVYRIAGSEPPEIVARRAELSLPEVKRGETDFLVFNGLLTSDLLLVQRRGGAPSFFTAEQTPDGMLRAGRQLAIAADATSVYYEARPVFYGDEETLNRDPLTWDATLVYVPPVARPFPDIAVVIQATDLRRAVLGTHLLPFQLTARAAATDNNSDIGGPPIQLPAAEDLEFFVDSPELESTGYYGDQPNDRGSLAMSADRAGDVDRQMSAPSDTSVNKSRLELTSLNGQPSFDVSHLVPGRSYRLFACFRSSNASGLYTPRPVVALDVLLQRTGELSPQAGRRVGQLEIISLDDWGQAQRRQDQIEDFLTINEFTAEAMTIPGNRPVRGIQFSCQAGCGKGAPEGGFEVVVQDAAESTLCWRLDNEIVADKAYRNEEVPFRDLSRWTIPERLPANTTDRLPSVPQMTPDALMGLKPELYLYIDESNPLLTDFLAAKLKLVEILQALDADVLAADGSHWIELHYRLTDWLNVVEQHRRSPLSNADGEQQRCREAMLRLARAILTGVAFQEGGEALDGTLAANLSELVELLPKLHEGNLREQSIGLDRESLTRFGQLLNLEDDAREVAGILMRRMAIADELLSPDPDGMENVPLAYEQREGDGWANEWLPRHDAMIAACDLAYSLLPGVGTPPELQKRVERLFFLIGFTSTGSLNNDPAARAAARCLLGVITKFSTSAGLTPPLGTVEESVKGYLRGPVGERLARLVPQAAGLTAAVNAVRSDLSARGLKLIRRPHRHGLGDATAPLQQETPAETRLADLAPQLFIHNGPLTSAPPDAANPAAPNRQALRAGVGGLLAIWEQLGFAVDVVVVDEQGEQAPRSELERHLAVQPWAEILLPLPAKHLPLLATVREPDGDTFSDPGGMATGKLVVLPIQLADLLTGDVKDSVAAPVGKFTVLVGAAQKFKLGRSGQALSAAEIIPRALWETDSSKIALEISITGTTQIPIPDVAPSTSEFSQPTTPLTPGEVDVSVRMPRGNLIRRWLAYRGIVADEADVQVLIDLHQQCQLGVTEPESHTGDNPLLRLTIEERDGASRMRPIRAQRIRGFWPMPLNTGHVLHVAVRRLSRYTSIVRWAEGEDLYQRPRPLAQVVRDSVLHRKPVEFLPQTVPSSDLGPSGEPAVRPQNLLVAPHPTHPGFIFQAPPSAQRSHISALSQTRTGFNSIDLQFFRQFLEDEIFRSVVEVKAALPIWAIEATATIENTSLIVTATPEAKLRWSNDDYAFLVDFGSGASQPILNAVTRALDVEQLTLTFAEEIPVTSPSARVLVLIVHKDATLRPIDHIRLSFENSNQTSFVITDASLPLPTEASDWNGKILRLIDPYGIDADLVRTVTSYDVVKRQLRFAPEADLQGREAWVYIGETPRQATALPPVAPPNPLLLRNHELMVPEDLPYPYRYAARFQARYHVESEEEVASTPSIQDDFIWAKRRPVSLGVHAPLLRRNGNGTEIRVRLYLSRLEDHLSPAERVVLATMPVAEDVSVTVGEGANARSFSIREIELPDPRLVYSLFWETQLAGSPGTFLERLVEARFKISEASGKMTLKVTYFARNGDGSNAREQTFDVSAWRSISGAIPTYECVIPLNTTLDRLGGLDGLQAAPERQLFLRCERDGFQSPYLSMEVGT